MLNILRSRLSDDEFVERIRRHTPTTRKVAVVMSIAYGLVLAALLYYVPRYVHRFRNMAPDAPAYDQGFALGVFVGSSAAGALIFLIWHLIHSLIIAFGPKFFRIHRLLLKYYDLATQRPTSAQLNDA
jgi:hypothetical protein